MKGQPLNKRGWTLQESLLSPRTLSYTAQQMTWECQERRVGESGRPILAGELYTHKSFVQDVISAKLSITEQASHKLIKISLRKLPFTWANSLTTEMWDAYYSRWFGITKEFTTRSLTVKTDTLPALSGLAAAFHGLLGDQYCAGLWRNDIVRGLLWSRRAKRDDHLVSKTVKEDSKDHHIPSWSWASIDGGPIFNSLAEEKEWPYVFPQETAKVLHITTTPRLSDPFGQITDGLLVIRAPFRLIQNPFTTKESRTVPGTAIEQRVLQEKEITASRAEYQQQHCHHPGQYFAIIRIILYHRDLTNYDGTNIRMPGTKLLVLETTGQREDEFRRIGLMDVAVPMNPDVDDRDVKFLEEMKAAKWRWKEVRIV